MLVVSRTPLRVSFFGGMTDYPAWFQLHGGRTLSCAIDKYVYLTVREHQIETGPKYGVVWSRDDEADLPSGIKHPLVRAYLEEHSFDEKSGLEIHYQADLPARSGIGSSSAFSVGIIKAMALLCNEAIYHAQLAQSAIRLEREILGEAGGWQDQIIVSHGGFQTIDFHTDKLTVQPCVADPLRIKSLFQNLLLVYVGRERSGPEVAAQIDLTSHEATLHKIQAQVHQAVGILTGRVHLSQFGELLDEAWHLKQEIVPIEPDVHAYYCRAREVGCVGGKLLGAGKSGFLLLYVPVEKQERLVQSLGLPATNFKVDYFGSQAWSI